MVETFLFKFERTADLGDKYLRETMLRLRGQTSVEIHVVAHTEAWQPGVFNYIHEKLKISRTVGQVAQWLESWTRK